MDTSSFIAISCVIHIQQRLLLFVAPAMSRCRHLPHFRAWRAATFL